MNLVADERALRQGRLLSRAYVNCRGMHYRAQADTCFLDTHVREGF